MPGTQKVRGRVNVLMNRLVREGVISSFKTNFGFDNETPSPRVTITVPEGRSQDAVRALVLDAVTEAAIGIDIAIDCA